MFCRQQDFGALKNGNEWMYFIINSSTLGQEGPKNEKIWVYVP